MDAKMKKQLEQTITAIVEEDTAAAKKALQEYLRAKTHSILVRESDDKDVDDENDKDVDDENDKDEDDGEDEDGDDDDDDKDGDKD